MTNSACVYHSRTPGRKSPNCKNATCTENSADREGLGLLRGLCRAFALFCGLVILSSHSDYNPFCPWHRLHQSLLSVCLSCVDRS